MQIEIDDEIVEEYRKAWKMSNEAQVCSYTPKQRVSITERFLKARGELNHEIDRQLL